MHIIFEKFLRDSLPHFWGLAACIDDNSAKVSFVLQEALLKFLEKEKDFGECMHSGVDQQGKRHLREFFREKMFEYVLKESFKNLRNNSQDDDQSSRNVFGSIDPLVRSMLFLHNKVGLDMEMILRITKGVSADNRYQKLARFNSGRDRLIEEVTG